MAVRPRSRSLAPLASAALIFTLAAGAAARPVPSISDTREEQYDPEVEQDPQKKDLVTLAIHHSDLITDDFIIENNVPGLDFFINNLQKELRRGNDIPRNDILDNAVEARDMHKEASQNLKQAVLKLLEARDKLVEVNNELQPASKRIQEDFKTVKDIGGKLSELVQEMERETPQSKGEKVNASPLRNIEDMKQYLDPLPDMVEEAAKLNTEAKNWIEITKQIKDLLPPKTDRAKELDAKAYKQLGQSRTRGAANSFTPEHSSEKVLRNAHKWLGKAVEKAEKIQKRIEKLTEPGKGMSKAVAAARGANSKKENAKKTVQSSSKQANGSHKQFPGLQQAYESAPPGQEGDEQRQQAVQAADQLIAKSKKADEKSKRSCGGACKSCGKSKDASKATREALKELDKKLLGKEPSGERVPPAYEEKSEVESLQVNDLYVDVPPPPPPPQGAVTGGKKTKSRALTVPSVFKRERQIQGSWDSYR